MIIVSLPLDPVVTRRTCQRFHSHRQKLLLKGLYGTEEALFSISINLVVAVIMSSPHLEQGAHGGLL